MKWPEWLSGKERNEIPLPDEVILILTSKCLFPGQVISFKIKSGNEGEELFKGFLGFIFSPGKPKVGEIGTLGVARGEIKNKFSSAKSLSAENERETVKIMVGIRRFRIKGVLKPDRFYHAQIEEVKETIRDPERIKTLIKLVKRDFLELLKLNPEFGICLPSNSDEEMEEEIKRASEKLEDFTEPRELADFIAVCLFSIIDPEEISGILTTLILDERLRKLVKIMEGLIEDEKEIINEWEILRKERMEETLEYHRDQVEFFEEELGEKRSQKSKIEIYRERAKKAQMPPEIQKEFDQELQRLSQMGLFSHESDMIRTWLDYMIDMPWSKSTEDRLDINEAEKILEEDHYGLKKIKDRVLEFLVIRMRKSSAKSPILCFIGPPGTGKTSVGKSIARALGRKFVRISLGGVYDESQLRGHCRTYIGALPGVIVKEIRRVGYNNPVFMIDEVDKIGTGSFHGDPSSALLEILDPEQNNAFNDNYLGVPFDLSKVMFITTGNVAEAIQPALRDRMEIIDFPGYTREEKLEIARKYLIPRKIEQCKLGPNEIKFEDGVLENIVQGYTDEAGVRRLEQVIDSIFRKTAFKIAKKILKKVVVGKDNLIEFLGPPKYLQEAKLKISRPGLAVGLAVTETGGHILFIETVMDKNARRPGILLTGNLGKVMKESALTAASYIRANLNRFKLKMEDYPANARVHVHVPEGATPKDGPSAGISIFMSLFSLLTKRNFRHDVALTGEISLRGDVLPIGGVLSKVLAAKEAGIKTVILPKDNEKDLWDFPSDLKKSLEKGDFEIKFIKKMEEAIPLCLEE